MPDGKWKTIAELAEIDILTSEDFIKTSRLAAIAADFSLKHGLSTFDASKLEKQKGRITAIEEWLKFSGLSGDALKEKLMEYKIALFTGVPARYQIFPVLYPQLHQTAGSQSRDINLLKGLLFDGDGTPYSPTYTTKGKQQYRYYISQNLVQYRNHPKGIMARLPAQGLEHTIEQAVRSQLQNIQELTKLLGDRQNHDALEHITLHQSEISAAALVAAIIKRVTVGEQLLKLELRCRELKNLLNDKLQLSLLDPETESKIIEIPFEPRRGRKGALVIEAQGIKKDMFDLPPEALKKLVQGFIWRDEHFGGMTIQDIAAREGLTAPYLGQHIFRTFEQ